MISVQFALAYSSLDLFTGDNLLTLAVGYCADIFTI
jgi:hypothetical protein